MAVLVVIFWDKAPCSPYLNGRFGGTYRLHLLGRKSAKQETSLQQVAEDGGDTLLRNVGSRMGYTALYSRIWQHSFFD
jgi:hypothetical protein